MLLERVCFSSKIVISSRATISSRKAFQTFEKKRFYRHYQKSTKRMLQDTLSNWHVSESTWEGRNRTRYTSFKSPLVTTQAISMIVSTSRSRPAQLTLLRQVVCVKSLAETTMLSLNAQYKWHFLMNQHNNKTRTKTKFKDFTNTPHPPPHSQHSARMWDF